MKTFERLVGTELGCNHYARGIEIDGVELITSYEQIKTGDVKTEYKGNGFVYSRLTNAVNVVPTKCILAEEILTAMKRARSKRARSKQ